MITSKRAPECAICGQESQGIHFGVVSCRACSAFFRRSAFSKWSKIDCLSNNCRSQRNSYFHCKPCRLKRCLAAGMDSNKFQFDRDAIREPKLPQSFEVFVGRPEYVLFCTPGTSAKISHPKTLIDVSFLVEKAFSIMETGPEKVVTGKDQLHKISNGFSFLEKTEKVLKVSRIARKEMVMSIWEYYFLTTARWLSHFDEFQHLEQHLKMQLLFATWHVWGRLDKLIATAINRRRGLCKSKKELCLSNGIFVDVTKQRIDSTWLSDYDQEQVAIFINGVRSWQLIDAIDPLVDLEPSDVEVTFMMAQLCFEYAGKRFPGEIQEICDRFQEVLASNLHDYYVNDKKMIRYSGRLAKLMKVNSAIQKNIWENRPRIEVSKTFDIFKIAFSHPEMFIDTGF